MKKTLVPRTGVQAIDKPVNKALHLLKKPGITNDAWGALTGMGMYSTFMGENKLSDLASGNYSMDKSAVGRLITDKGNFTDVAKTALNLIPAARITNFANVPTYVGKAAIKVADKSGSLDRHYGGEPIVNFQRNWGDWNSIMRKKKGGILY